MPPGAVEPRPEYIIGSMVTKSMEVCKTKAKELFKEWDEKVAPTTSVGLRIACVPKKIKEEPETEIVA